ncbi:MAG: hypothetical protein J2P47_03845 [Acetobacteraceae bacterium]|nr:hypothetical protein [Acetobacteraceae bacterium]
MPLPIVFAKLPAGDNAASKLDVQFNAVADLVYVPCDVTGINDLALTPMGDAPAVTRYIDLAPWFVFRAAATSTGSVNINVAQLGQFPAFKDHGVTPMGAGDLVAGGIYRAVFHSGLNNGAGGFLVE